MSVKGIVSWFEHNRFVTLALVMIFIWSSLLTFFFLKTDEITKDPCTICAEKAGEGIMCSSINSFVPIRKYYYPNGTIIGDDIKVLYQMPDLEKGFNFSDFEE